MKWFKHMTDSLDDPFIQELMDRYSHLGYAVWFGLIEIITKENKHSVTGKLSVSPTYLRRKLRTSPTKLREVLDFCQTNGRLLVNFSKEKWEIDFPKIAEIKDNYTKDLQAACKKLSIEEEVEEEKEVEKEIEKKKRKIFSPKRATTPKNPEVSLFINHASETFKNKTGEKICIDGGKDGALVKGLLGTYGLDRLKGLWDTFLASTDPFIEQAGFSIGVFKSQVNKLLTAKYSPPKTGMDKTIESLQKFLENEAKNETDDFFALPDRIR